MSKKNINNFSITPEQGKKIFDVLMILIQFAKEIRDKKKAK